MPKHRKSTLNSVKLAILIILVFSLCLNLLIFSYPNLTSYAIGDVAIGISPILLVISLFILVFFSSILLKK